MKGVSLQIVESFKDYTPKSRIFTSEDEIKQVATHFELEGMSRGNLQIVRNAVVLQYSDWTRKARRDGDWDEFDRLQNAMMSITAVIDSFKYKAGAEV